MKILVVCYEFPPLGGGGGNAARDIATGLARLGHGVSVVTSGFAGLPRSEIVDGVEICRNDVLRSRREGTSMAGMALYIALSLWPALRKARAFRPDVIHAHFAVPSGVVASAAAWAVGKPLVITFHLGDVPGGAPGQTDTAFRIVLPFVRFVVGRAARLTAVSSFVRDLAEQAFGRRVAVVHNGVAIDAVPPAAAERNEGPVRLVFVGRFNPQKNVGLILQTLHGLGGVDWRLDLVGDGPDMALARRLADELGLADRVIFHGWLEPPAVERVMAASDVLLMPSKFEGMPVAGVQALRHGLAIAGSTAPGLADVLQDGVNGFTAPIDDVRAFRDGLARLLGDPSRLASYKSESRKRADEFALDKIVGRYEAILAEAAGSGR